MAHVTQQTNNNKAMNVNIINNRDPINGDGGYLIVGGLQ
jgi:hypothetical protein